MPYVFRENAEEFIARHGAYVFHPSDRSLVFADGATLRGEGPLQERREPPTHPTELLVAQRRYVELKLAREIADFQRYRDEYTTLGNLHRANPMNCPAPPPNAAAMLRGGRDRIVLLRERLAEMDAKLAATPEGRARAMAQREEAQRKREVDVTLEEIMSIALS